MLGVARRPDAFAEVHKPDRPETAAAPVAVSTLRRVKESKVI
ncbi:hypothetical protein Z946_2391 [Sulfitobacter noctilucicola]|nr:hypothetical protein Z946_2391 [Sulfitobacter noctilucicola]